MAVRHGAGGEGAARPADLLVVRHSVVIQSRLACIDSSVSG